MVSGYVLYVGCLMAKKKKTEKPVIEVWKENDWSPYPWRFKITFKGVTHDFIGIPNKCPSKRSASMRARWRAKWIMNGTYDQHYVPF